MGYFASDWEFILLYVYDQTYCDLCLRPSIFATLLRSGEDLGIKKPVGSWWNEALYKQY